MHSTSITAVKEIMKLILSSSKKGKIIGLEIKSGRSQQASGIPAFCKECNPFKVLLVGNSGIPWQEFLELNPLELFN